MDDLMRRSDAIKAMADYLDLLGVARRYAKSVINKVPSAEPKQGEWSFIGDNMFECSHCGITYSTKQFDAIRNYTTDPFAPEHCPKCGAKMKGADDEQV